MRITKTVLQAPVRSRYRDLTKKTGTEEVYEPFLKEPRDRLMATGRGKYLAPLFSAAHSTVCCAEEFLSGSRGS